MNNYVKVGAAVPELKVADPKFNVNVIKDQVNEAIKNKVNIISFPELSITGYTCGDLFRQDLLIDASYEALFDLKEFSKNQNIVIIVGMPIRLDNMLFNTGVVINNGKILGIVPKTYIPNYQEFYEQRWFAPSFKLQSNVINLFNEEIPIGTDLIFTLKDDPRVKFSIEICEDLWSVIPPSNYASLAGTLMTFNLSASNEVIGKCEYRKNLVSMQSAKTISAYIYASSGVNESTSDLLFSGSSMIAENGKILKENNRFNFNSNLIIADIDYSKLINERTTNISYTEIISNKNYRNIYFDTKLNKDTSRISKKTPFVPTDDKKRDSRCKEIINIQACALAKRLKHTKINKCVVGISGGLDSTLAFLVIIEAYKKLGISNDNIIAVTMPGFGTTNRTYLNAKKLVTEYGATLKEISIKNSVLTHFNDINQDPDKHDITYENSQARERTQILMDVANKENALVIGTGDMSELALGWCTYNGDHMSMYAVNTSIPKTLVKYLVKYVADNNSNTKKVLYDILDTPISPELLPPDKDGKIKQVTEDNIGPYILHDFFLYHFLRFGEDPIKIYEMANNTFKDDYTSEEILKWLKVFVKRFFTQQFKRNCMPDGVKVGSVSLSPRGDLRMPSDASYNIWMDELNSIEVYQKIKR